MSLHEVFEADLYLNASVSGMKVTSALSITPMYLAMRVTREVISMELLPKIIFCQ